MYPQETLDSLSSLWYSALVTSDNLIAAIDNYEAVEAKLVFRLETLKMAVMTYRNLLDKVDQICDMGIAAAAVKSSASSEATNDA